MKDSLTRRRFLKTTTLGAGVVVASHSAVRAANAATNSLKIGVMGLGRGLAHVRAAIDTPNVDVRYLCDVDLRRIKRAMKFVQEKNAPAPKGTQDFRVILDDKGIDAIMIATPNHWHASATILGCSAGKHVYVEKPGSYDPHEGELMVAAARKYRRVVQMGTQRRSWPGIIEAIQKVRSGAIGDVTFARCWYSNARGSIGRGRPAPVPDYLNYDLWQGPAPQRHYKDNLIHYNWHWHWHWGNGELGNNGIHTLDLARWGLDVDYPLTVTYNGGRYHFEDDQETPDTGVAVYHFGTKGASWEASSCHPRRNEHLGFVTFYGSGGALAISGKGYKIFDLSGKLVTEADGDGGDRIHMDNFFDCLRSGQKPNAEIEIGQKSTLLCHLGNIAYRLGRTIHFDPIHRRITADPAAAELWSRHYRKGWEPRV